MSLAEVSLQKIQDAVRIVIADAETHPGLLQAVVVDGTPRLEPSSERSRLRLLWNRRLGEESQAT